MTKSALSKRLQKAKSKPSVSISIRLPHEIVEALDDIENKTELRYDWLIRILLKRFLKSWNREKSVKFPICVFVMSVDEARKRGLDELGDFDEFPAKNDGPKKRES